MLSLNPLQAFLNIICHSLLSRVEIGCTAWGWLSSGGGHGLQNRWAAASSGRRWVRLPSTPVLSRAGRAAFLLRAGDLYQWDSCDEAPTLPSPVKRGREPQFPLPGGERARVRANPAMPQES
jgi:hypothetical protein